MPEETVVTETETPQETGTPLADLFDASTPSSAVTEKVEAKSTEEAPVKTEEKPTEGKTEETPKPSEEGKKEEKPVEDERTLMEKRLTDTRNYATRVNQENQELKREIALQGMQLEKISKQLDGTWTPEEEENFNRTVNQSGEVDPAVSKANFEGRLDASMQAAIGQYGEEYVAKMLHAEDAPFRAIQNDPVVMAKVMSSPAPALEALKIVKSRQFFEKWGFDPETIEKNMRKSIETELTEKITKRLMDNFNRKNSTNIGIRDIPGSDNQSPAVGAFTPLTQLFDSR